MGDLEMEVSMTVMLVVREISCVGVTTAGNSELTTMRRTTAVREQPLHSNPPSLPNLIGMRSRGGDRGLAGAPAATPVELAGRPDRGNASASARITISLRTRSESALILIVIFCKRLSQ